jgi:hypothetical protein
MTRSSFKVSNPKTALNYHKDFTKSKIGTKVIKQLQSQKTEVQKINANWDYEKSSEKYATTYIL